MKIVLMHKNISVAEFDIQDDSGYIYGNIEIFEKERLPVEKLTDNFINDAVKEIYKQNELIDTYRLERMKYNFIYLKNRIGNHQIREYTA